MDDALAAQAAVDARVAAAADAWLTDPLDAGVYGRLVRAVQDRRAHLALGSGDGPTDEQTADGQAADEAVLLPEGAAGDDDLPEGGARGDDVLDPLDVLADRRPVQSLGATLAGTDPRALLDRLRRGNT